MRGSVSGVEYSIASCTGCHFESNRVRVARDGTGVVFYRLSIMRADGGTVPPASGVSSPSERATHDRRQSEQGSDGRADRQGMEGSPTNRWTRNRLRHRRMLLAVWQRQSRHHGARGRHPWICGLSRGQGRRVVVSLGDTNPENLVRGIGPRARTRSARSVGVSTAPPGGNLAGTRSAHAKANRRR